MKPKHTLKLLLQPLGSISLLIDDQALHDMLESPEELILIPRARSFLEATQPGSFILAETLTGPQRFLWTDISFSEDCVSLSRLNLVPLLDTHPELHWRFARQDFENELKNIKTQLSQQENYYAVLSQILEKIDDDAKLTDAIRECWNQNSERLCFERNVRQALLLRPLASAATPFTDKFKQRLARLFRKHSSTADDLPGPICKLIDQLFESS